jgi:lipoprotein-anchoring transpeptidase ErfK/SrfK
VTSPHLAGRSRRAAVLIAALSALALVASACSSSTTGGNGTTSSGSSSSSSSTAPSSTSSSSKPTVKVHIKSINADTATYGVGMPVIVFFNHTIKSAKAFQDATKVTADGKALAGAWFFETSSYYKGYPIEAHWRVAPRPGAAMFWPAHSQIHVDIPVKGLSGGGNFVFDDSLTLDFFIGASHIGTVDDSGSPHTLTITNDGKFWAKFPVSLGATDTPTRSGIKVIMEKGRSICMHGPGYSECGVKYTQRLTYDGEYLHSAPWNIGHIDSGIDSSNGCTNMLPTDAQKAYGFLEVGDVVEYPNANGGRMQLGQGYGDWNVPWAQWQTGGLVSTQH